MLHWAKDCRICVCFLLSSSTMLDTCWILKSSRLPPREPMGSSNSVFAFIFQILFSKLATIPSNTVASQLSENVTEFERCFIKLWKHFSSPPWSHLLLLQSLVYKQLLNSPAALNSPHILNPACRFYSTLSVFENKCYMC